MAAMNERQQEAVNCLEGPLLLLAGAGTGKTTVIVHRIANLVHHGIEPNGILAVTFTNKAAKEMRERISAYIGPQAAKAMTICTFHSFCAQVLRKHINRLGYSRRYTIASDSYQHGLVLEIMNQLGQVGSGYDTKLWRDRISMAKAACLWPDDIREESYPKAAEVADVYEAYQKRLKQMDLLDFDDLLSLTVKLWQDFPEILDEYKKRYKRIMIDEYQDTNGVQLRLMTMLAGKEGNICVVGDDDQSIYGWRGADIENILHFDKTYPDAKIIRLEQNYRSTGIILKAANGVIAHNKERHVKNLWSQKGDGEIIKAVRCEDEDKEAEFLVRNIRETHQNRNLPWKSFAVLFRSNRQSRAIEDAFRKARIPYQLVGGTSFYQTKEILDAGAFLAAVANPKDDLSFLRILNVPPRGIGDVTIERLRTLRDERHKSIQELAASPEVLKTLPGDSAASLNSFVNTLARARAALEMPGNLHDKVRRLFDDVGYLDGLGRMYKPRENALARRENVLELLSAIAAYDERNASTGTLDDLLEEMSLLDTNDRVSKPEAGVTDTVTLMTVHAAKGLEFPTVYVAGMERNLFPHTRAMEEGNEAEERRLFYVAITRAQKELILTYAEKRREGKIMMPHPPSKFLDELPEDTVRFCKPADLYLKVSSEDAIKMLLAGLE